MEDNKNRLVWLNKPIVLKSHDTSRSIIIKSLQNSNQNEAGNWEAKSFDLTRFNISH